MKTFALIAAVLLAACSFSAVKKTPPVAARPVPTPPIQPLLEPAWDTGL